MAIRAAWPLCILLLLPLGSTGVFGQNVADSTNEVARLRSALVALKSGTRLRLQVEGGRLLEGKFLGLEDDALLLAIEQQSRTVPFAQAIGLWRLGRATKSGARKGAFIGGVGGAVGLGMLFYLAANLCDSEDCPQDNTSFAAWGAIIGLVFGAGAGALTGATVGAAFPQWRPVYLMRGRAGEPVRSREPGRQPPSGFGSASLFFGMAFDRSPDRAGGSFLARVNLMAHLTPHVALGPEIGYFEMKVKEATPAAGIVPTRRRSEAWQVTAALRYALRPEKLGPYGVVGAGYYNSHSLSYLGYHFGVGVSFSHPDRRFLLAAEWRWHANLQHLAGSKPRFMTILAGAGLLW